jgi:hypothetical protein
MLPALGWRAEGRRGAETRQRQKRFNIRYRLHKFLVIGANTLFIYGVALNKVLF